MCLRVGGMWEQGCWLRGVSESGESVSGTRGWWQGLVAFRAPCVITGDCLPPLLWADKIALPWLSERVGQEVFLYRLAVSRQ